jgi:hypothetical protein
MSKNKRTLKKDFTIKKVRRVMKSILGNFGTYDVYKVTGPNKIKKYFITRQHAKAYIDKITDTTI